MVVRVAACAAAFFVYSVCARTSGDTLSFPGIAVAMAQEMPQRQAIAALDQNVYTEGKTQAAPREDTKPL